MAVAFSGTVMSKLHENLRRLYDRRRAIGKLTLTFDEYIDTFVYAEARETFRAAAPFTMTHMRRVNWDLHLSDGGKLDATMMFCESATPPRYAPPIMRHIGIQGDAPADVVERIRDWAERGGDASREFGRVRSVLEILNQNFSRVAIRYYWPTILALANESKNTKDIADDLQELRQPPKLKPLPPGLMVACRQAAETIANARLIPADVQEPEPGEVTIDIVTGQQYHEAFGQFYGMN